jgi:hypothetical protein
MIGFEVAPFIKILLRDLKKQVFSNPGLLPYHIIFEALAPYYDINDPDPHRHVSRLDEKKITQIYYSSCKR